MTDAKVTAAVLGAATVLLMLLPSRVSAHASEPVFVQIDERSPGEYAVHWKVPRVLPQAAAPEVLMLARCTALASTIATSTAEAYVFSRSYRCVSLGGAVLQLRYPEHNPALSTVVRVSFLSGERYIHLLGPQEGTWRPPEQGSRWSISGEYLRLGTEHILSGLDHLLFVLCVLLVAGTGRRLFMAITGFTVGHSVTLALASLGMVRLYGPPIEASIALSIMLLAAEIVRGDTRTLSHRYTGLICTIFGLVHGFGFAGALQELGLPRGEVFLALLSFNVGVELGQLLFIGTMLVLLGLVSATAPKGALRVSFRWPDALPRRLSVAAAYLCGIVATVWYVERVAQFWPGRLS